MVLEATARGTYREFTQKSVSPSTVTGDNYVISRSRLWWNKNMPFVARVRNKMGKVSEQYYGKEFAIVILKALACRHKNKVPNCSLFQLHLIRVKRS